MKIILADAYQEVRAALRLVIEHRPGLHVAGEARDTIELIGQITTECPQVILLDPELPGVQLVRRRTSLAELVNIIHMLCPAVRVFALSSHPGAEKDCTLAKIDAFFCKSDPPDALLALLLEIERAN